MVCCVMVAVVTVVAVAAAVNATPFAFFQIWTSVTLDAFPDCLRYTVTVDKPAAVITNAESAFGEAEESAVLVWELK